MKTIKLILAVGLLVVLWLPGFAQTTCEHDKIIDLTGQVFNNVDKCYEARDKVVLGQGFKYTRDNASNTRFVAKLNEHLIQPVDYVTNPVDLDLPRDLDKSLPVGATAGSFNVSPSGAAMYNIPIIVPSGANNLQPNISITYNSQSGNGILGYGWSLSGISQINRVGSNFYSDNNVKDIMFDINDKFVLNGNRLIVTSGNYGEENSEYTTEMESFNKITALGSNSSGPVYFTLKTKDNQTIEYGNPENNAQVIVPSSTYKIVSWLISKITDPNGNIISYIYSTSQMGEKYLKRIEYTYSNNDQPYNIIEFYYESRDDKNRLFIGGNSIYNSLLLYKISSKTNNQLFKEYYFNYIPCNNYSALNSITETDGKGHEYNKTLFNYKSDNTEINLSGGISGFPNNYYGRKQCIMDINNDGKSDLLLYYKSPGSEYMHQLALYFNTSSPYSSQPEYTYSLLSILIEQLSSSEYFEFIDFYPGDYNGDGLTDFITSYNLDDGNGNFECHFNLYLLIQGSVNLTYHIIGDIIPHFEKRLNKNDIIQGDFNGDGKTELSVRNDYGPNDFFHIYKISEISSYPYIGYEEIMISPSSILRDIPQSKILPGDFNGNGKLDFLYISSYTYLFEYNNLTGSFELDYDLTSNCIPFDPTKAYYGDVNGDGRMDVLFWNIGWKLYFNSGSSFSYSNIQLPLYNENPETGSKFYYIADYNGDGKSDIFEAIYENLNYKIKIHFFNGSNFITSTEYIVPATSIQFYERQGFPYYDINGDGKCDVLAFTSSGQPKLFTYNAFSQNNLLAKISDGYNNTIEIDYTLLTNSIGNHYFPGDNSNLFNQLHVGTPIISMPLSLNVVSNYKFSNCVGGKNETTLKYTGAKINTWRHNFLGFESVSSHQVQSNITNNSKNSFFSMTNDKSMILTELTQSSCFYGNQQINQTDYDYEFSYLPSGSIFITLNNVLQNDILTGLSMQTIYTYNSFDKLNGNITSKKIEKGDYSKTTDYRYININSWLQNKVLYQQTTEKRTGEPNVSSKIVYDYYPSGNTNTVYLYNNVNMLTAKKKLFYNNFGNIVEEQTLVDGHTISNKFEYDENGRFMKIIINPLDYTVSEITYDERIGKPITIKDINGLSTSYKYDGFGRLIESTSPTGKKINNLISFLQNSTIDNALYYSKTWGDSIPEKFDYYNSFGQIVRNETRTFNNQIAISNIEYDEFGRAIKESLPYFFGTPIYKEIGYDEYGRISSEETPVQQIQYSYTGLTTTITKAGQVSSKTLDNTGSVYSSTDDGGTIIYEYEADGKIKSVQNNGATTLLTYDDNRNQHTLTDPNTGTITYLYNNRGFLIDQTDNLGNHSEMQYDVLGRVIDKLIENGNKSLHYTYVYDTEQYGKGLISEINGPDFIQNYKYDKYQQIIELTETIQNTLSQQTENVTLTTKYSYNGLGALNSVTYPSNFAIKYEYDDNSNLSKIKKKDNNQIIWQLQDINALGIVTQYSMGNNKETNIQYDDYGLPVRFTTNGIMDYGFVFDQERGNLAGRTDYLRDMSEGFGYDELDRLTEYYRVSQGPLTFQHNYLTYNNNGNIASKTDIGTYSYDPADQPHAVKSVDNTSNEISTTDQVINYTLFGKVESIIEGEYSLLFAYGSDDERRISVLKQNNADIKTKYFGQNYELIKTPLGIKEINYINCPEGLCAIYIKEGSQENMYYTYSDYLGSLMYLTDENGIVVEERSYDPWGRQRNPSNWDYTLTSTTPIVDIGFTSHENLPEFNLINMNGRLYDPMLGRMLSPDNFVHSIDNTQCYNRYSYCLNNPLKYTDPSGDFVVVDSWLIGFVHGFFSTGSGRWSAGWNEANQRAGNDAKIWGGLFVSDPNKSFFGRVWEVTSRLTWQAPQTGLGFLYNQSVNTITPRVEEVDYFHGATYVVGATRGGNAVSLGSYISISPIQDDDQAHIRIGEGGYTTMHEYGHYLQSKKSGPLYLLKYGIPSALGDADWTEHDANTRAANYFQKIDPNFSWVQTSSRYRTLADKVHNPRWFEYPLYISPIGLALIIAKNWSEPW